jgi:hypothetical protein
LPKHVSVPHSDEIRSTLFICQRQRINYLIITKHFSEFIKFSELDTASNVSSKTISILIRSANTKTWVAQSVVSGYGLDDRAIEVRSPTGAEDSSYSLFVQTGSGAHPASCTMGTGGPFPGAKSRPGCNADHSPPSIADVVNE